MTGGVIEPVHELKSYMDTTWTGSTATFNVVITADGGTRFLDYVPIREWSKVAQWSLAQGVSVIY